MSERAPVCVDLFAGAGGMALGLERAGFEVMATVEIDEVAGQTYRRNLLAGRSGTWARLGPEEGDVREIEFGQLQHHLASQGIDRVDLICGGPPCQGFSRVGRGKLMHLDDMPGAHWRDRRNSLVFEMCRAAEVLRPRAVLIENVTGMLNLGGVNRAEEVCEELELLGYRVRLTVLNAAWYGVPQNRERLFLLALAPDLEVPGQWFPTPIHRGRGGAAAVGAHTLRNASFRRPDHIETHWPDEAAQDPVTVGEAFEDLPSFTRHLGRGGYSAMRGLHEPTEYACEPAGSFARLMRHWEGLESDGRVHDHYCRNTPRDFRIFARMEPGETYQEAVRYAAELYREAMDSWEGEGEVPQPRPEDFIPPYPLDTFADRWKKLDLERPSWTVTAHLSRDCYSHIHPDPDQARTISIREAARLQSFPDAFILEGNTGDCFRQIGNAVPPLLAHALGEQIQKHLEHTVSRPTPSWEEVSPPRTLWTPTPAG